MGIIDSLNKAFQAVINLGAAPMMLIVFTLLGIIMKVKPGKALEGGIRLAVALTGMSAVISMLTTNFSPALKDFVQNTGINLSVTDVGWPPLATITWGTVYTLYFAALCLVVNVILLVLRKTDTLNVDIFNLWQMSVFGLLVMYYGKNIIIATGFVAIIYVFALKNADVLKPSMNYMLGYKKNNVTTCAHVNMLIAPFVYLIDLLIDKCFPFVDKFDFDAAKLNEKVGFWGSKFAIGTYLGIFVGLLGRQTSKEIFTLAFTGGVCLELFGFIGGWFGEAVKPISDGVTAVMQKRFAGRTLNIGIDWPFLGARAEVWAVANLLAPLMLVISVVLPGNRVLPLGGILLTCLAPTLMLISRGRIVRMLVEGVCIIPVMLWTGTAITNFVMDESALLGSFPSGIEQGTSFTSIEGGPVEKILAIFIGKANDVGSILCTLAVCTIYVVIFLIYFKGMKKKNEKLMQEQE